MKYIYIKELSKKEEIPYFNRIPKFMKNFIWCIIKKYNFIIKRKIEENKVILLVSNTEQCYKKIKKKIEKEKIKAQKLQIILSKKLKQIRSYLKDYKIVEGKWYFLNLLEPILEKALRKEPLEMQNIYLLTHQYSEQSIMLIRKIAPKVKSINVITKEIGRYMKLEEIMNEQGIAMSVANNKRKSLKNAKIIINLNFSKEEINQYVIFRNSLIINLTQEKLLLKGFEGIIIQDLEIELQEEHRKWIERYELKDEFKQLEIYETILEEKDKEDLHISSLYGNNGKITEKELINWQKILTN